MKNICFLFLFLFLSLGHLHSQNYSSKKRYSREITAADIGIDIGAITSFSELRNIEWKVMNVSSTEQASKVINKLKIGLSDFKFEVLSFEFFETEKAMFCKCKVTSDIEDVTFRDACLNSGITYIKMGVRVKFINSK